MIQISYLPTYLLSPPPSPCPRSLDMSKLTGVESLKAQLYGAPGSAPAFVASAPHHTAGGTGSGAPDRADAPARRSMSPFSSASASTASSSSAAAAATSASAAVDSKGHERQ